MFKEDEVKNEVNVSGSWNFEFEIQKSSMKSYIGKTSEFTLHITHLDNKIDGRGEKWKYDGDTIPHSRRIKLNVQGKYENDTLEFTFKQFGSSRHSFGFAKAVFKDGKFEGTFNADAADSKGKIHGIKVKV